MINQSNFGLTVPSCRSHECCEALQPVLVPVKGRRPPFAPDGLTGVRPAPQVPEGCRRDRSSREQSETGLDWIPGREWLDRIVTSCLIHVILIGLLRPIIDWISCQLCSVLRNFG